MGFLDKAKKMAEQAKGMAEDAIEDVRSKQAQGQGTSASEAPATPKPLGTPYVPGMLGRPGWREKGLVDPAAVLPIAERDRVGVPRSTKSQVVEEPYGMGRRWSAGERSAALFYQLYPEQLEWQPPSGVTSSADAGGSTATLDDGRTLVFLGDKPRVVLEVNGLDDGQRTDLARIVSEQLAAG